MGGSNIPMASQSPRSRGRVHKESSDSGGDYEPPLLLPAKVDAAALSQTVLKCCDLELDRERRDYPPSFRYSQKETELTRGQFLGLPSLTCVSLYVRINFPSRFKRRKGRLSLDGRRSQGSLLPREHAVQRSVLVSSCRCLAIPPRT